MRRLLLGALLLCGLAASATAQTVSGDRFRLNTGPCTIRSGSGAPEGVVTGAVCDTYHRVDAPYSIYRKTSGAGTTGWVLDSVTPAALTKTDDTNVTLTLGGSPTTAVLAPTSITASWTGTLAAPRLNANVVHLVTNDTNVTGSIAAQTLTLGWTGLVSLARGGTNANLTANLGGIFYSGASAGAILAGTATAGQMLRSGASAAPAWSTTTWPATSTATRLLFSTAANTIGEDADLTFATDTLTATKAVTPTSLTTPAVYGYGSTKVLALGGTGVVGCDSPPTGAGCEALSVLTTSPFSEQRLTTDPSTRTQWYVGTDGGHLNAYNGTSWLPLRLAGAPVQIDGGGFHVGSTAILDPGLGNTALDGYIGVPGYVSQVSGWRIDGLGAADFRYLYTDELHAKVFIADLEQALAGGQIISKSVGQLGAAFTTPAKGSISVLTMKDLPSAANMAIFESGDWVRIRTFSRAAGSLSITDAWGTVSSYADAADGLQTWNFQRALGDDGGAMASGTVVAVDAIVLDYGVSGNGFHEVNAIDGLYGINSPYSQIVTWAGSSPRAANQTVRSRLGNLRGITGVAEFGLLAGTYAATNGRYLKASDLGFELHGIDLKLWSGATNVYRLDHTTPYQSMGSPAPTTYSSGNGFWSGIDGGVFKWRIGNPTSGTNLIAWDGSTLSIVGAITVSGTLPDANNALALVGTAGATVVSGAALGTLGLDASGNPLIPAVAAPGAAKLYLSATHLGYWNGSAWRTYLDNAGNFYLGGTSGPLTWTAGTNTLNVTGNITITGGSGYANLSDKPTLGTLAALNAVAWATNITGIPAPLGAPSGSGLFLSSTNLGYYASGTWMTYMDNSGNFYLGGTSGKLQWNGSVLAIEGTVIAVAGAIGGWSLGSTYVRDVSGVVGMSSAVTGGDDIRFWAGDATPESAEFRVTESGALVANNAQFSGPVIYYGTLSPTALSAGINTAYAPSGITTATFLRLTSNSSTATLGGIAGGVGGRQYVISNVDINNGWDIVIAPENGAESAANRFTGPGNCTLRGSFNDTVTVIYDAVSARWRIVACTSY